ncbi:carbon-nitrogen hydrolase family protein [Mycolicibacterium aichiense]|uniref:Carbon-nitrogen hydrolase n=1 Tax=Mycolicibacterium aichiense TaxID=1799 RepID=A0AAD1HT28_9MYCO|nr:carbon-nitrogen hydrolase family protein [Mycolicibacterium aichiense]MCV7017023.1 carbon-nitrogen hydrolase family protein [Mycolicibacterium aichiense]BBX10550.1 carbon-nitrogen hydrolase [Mycolicibacterium aichiense]STZ25792.1 putative hydrolase [Mycolicibacterium aichiense]
MSALVVAAAQLPACGHDPEQNLAVVEAALTDAAAAGADLVVFPELATTPYFGGEPPGAYRDQAQSLPGPQSERIAERAAELGVAVVFPLFERDDGAHGSAPSFHNSAVVLDEQGVTVPCVDRTGQSHLVARKLHLPVGDHPAPGFDEPAHFTPGQWLGVHTVLGTRLGVLICYDRRFPECWRELRALHADLVAVPVAGSGGDSVDFFLAELRTHARENGLFAVVANKIGIEWVSGQPVDNYGESCIVGPDGELIAHRPGADGPGLVIAEIDLDVLAETRRTLRYFEHRRTDLFPAAEEIA